MVLPGNEGPTYGERMTRVRFNNLPAGNEDIVKLKREFAALIDRVNDIKANPTDAAVMIEPIEYAMHQGWKAQSIHYLHLASMLAVAAMTCEVERVDPAQFPTLPTPPPE